MPRWNIEEITSGHQKHRAVAHGGCCLPTDDHAHVFYFTKLGTLRPADMLRPPPARFVGRASDRHAAETNDFKPALLECADFIGLFESFQKDIEIVFGHGRSDNCRTIIQGSSRILNDLAKAELGSGAHRLPRSSDHADMLIRPDLPGVEILQAQFRAYRYSRHAHEHAVIGLVDSGLQSYTYRGAHHITGPQGLFFVNAGEAHTGEPGDEQGYIYRSLCLDESVLSRLFEDRRLHQLRFKDPVVYNSKLHNRLGALHCAVHTGRSTLACEQLLMDFIEVLSHCNAQQNLTPRTCPADRPAVRKIRALIHDDPAQDHSLAELARMVGMSPYHLAHVFTAEVGAPIFVYAEGVRMSRARRMLKSTLPIVEIALDLGFSDQSHFTRRFKQNEGITPARYRRAAGCVGTSA